MAYTEPGGNVGPVSGTGGRAPGDLRTPSPVPDPPTPLYSIEQKG